MVKAILIIWLIVGGTPTNPTQIEFNKHSTPADNMLDCMEHAEDLDRYPGVAALCVGGSGALGYGELL